MFGITMKHVDDLMSLYWTDPMFSHSVSLLSFLTLAIWLRSVAIDNYSVVDCMWSILPGIYSTFFFAYALYSAYSSGMTDSIFSFLYSHPRLSMLTAIPLIWGTRLTYNFWRKGGYEPGAEDYRWCIVRARINNETLFQIFNVIFIAGYQNIQLYLLAVSSYFAASEAIAKRYVALTWWDILVFTAWCFFFVIEVVADEQQWAYYTRRDKWRVQMRAEKERSRSIAGDRSRPQTPRNVDLVAGDRRGSGERRSSGGSDRLSLDANLSPVERASASGGAARGSAAPRLLAGGSRGSGAGAGVAGAGASVIGASKKDGKEAKADRADGVGDGEKIVDVDGDLRRGFQSHGLFAYSRHPNYWAEQSMWVCVGLLGLSVDLKGVVQRMMDGVGQMKVVGVKDVLGAVGQTVGQYIDLHKWGINLPSTLPAASSLPSTLPSAWSESLWQQHPWFCMLGPVLLVILFHASTSFSESISVSKYPQYAAYQANVSRFWPWKSSVQWRK